MKEEEVAVSEPAAAAEEVTKNGVQEVSKTGLGGFVKRKTFTDRMKVRILN